MRILFYNPPFMGRYSRAQRSPAITKSGTLYYPIWLAYAAGWAEKLGNEVKIIDSPAQGIDEEKSAEIITQFSPNLLIVQTTTATIDQDIQIACEIKKRHSDSYISLVGTHVSALADETLKKNTNIDSVIRGEYEETVAHLANTLENHCDLSEVDGLSYFHDGKIIHNKERKNNEDLDKYPFVSKIYKEHLNIKDYFFAAARYPMIQMFTSRGCPAHCFFCVYPQVFHGHKLRSRSPENIVAEFEYIASEIPEVKEIVVEDDTFTFNEDHVKKVCQLILDRGLKVVWNANARVSLTYETMKQMKAAGCRLVIPGYESGNQNVLNAMKKGITLEQSRQFAKNARKAKLMVHGCFLVGGPGETKETMEETFKFAMELSPDTAQFFPIMVYPGTEAYSWALHNGYLTASNFSEWNNREGGHNTLVSRAGLSADELNEFCNRARKRYYIRLSYIINNVIKAFINRDERRRLWLGYKSFSRHLFR